MYYIYMLRCKDDSIYTGITTNLENRMNEHFNKTEKCAKYTFIHIATKLESAWETENRQLASKLEYHIKKLNRNKKEELISKSSLEGILDNKIDFSQYKSIIN